MYTDRYIVSRVLWSYSLLFTVLVAVVILNKLSLQRMLLSVYMCVPLNQVL